MLSQAVQDYVKVIYKFQESGLVSTTEISKELNVSGASVTGMLKRLSTMGLVVYSSYKGVKLSDAGIKVALEIIRFHRLLETYLKEMLGFSLDKVHEEACRLEHFISSEFIEKITAQLGDPKFDPHGHPIPSIDGEFPDINEILLINAENKSEYTISRLSDDDPKLLNYLEKSNLVPNTKIMAIENEPLNGIITIMLNGNEKVLGYNIASNIYVKTN